jgi:hypothetical protein
MKTLDLTEEEKAAIADELTHIEELIA